MADVSLLTLTMDFNEYRFAPIVFILGIYHYTGDGTRGEWKYRLKDFAVKFKFYKVHISLYKWSSVDLLVHITVFRGNVLFQSLKKCCRWILYLFSKHYLCKFFEEKRESVVIVFLSRALQDEFAIIKKVHDRSEIRYWKLYYGSCWLRNNIATVIER